VFICPGCGEWSEDRLVVEAEVVCNCGHRRAITRLPLLLVCGASGTGKSTLCQHLAGTLHQVVVLDHDIIWMPEMDTPDDGWRRFKRLWLQTAFHIGQNGRPVMLFGAADPEGYASLPESRYLARIDTLALVCEDDVLRERLLARPDWRRSGGDGFIAAMIDVTHALRRLADRQPDRITLLDTTHDTVEQSAEKVASWAASILGREQMPAGVSR